MRFAIIYTTEIIAAEVFTKYFKDKKDVHDAMTALQVLATLLNLDLADAETSAQIYIAQRKLKEKFRLADAHVVAAAKKGGAKILTCDHDFAGIPEAMIK
ncbi:MAG TPA: PIN domain-containing protein [Candidatus Nanoarchaeia archaeon]|nr:PIN domain-containing protein [Candidatus Nanoarchaeia archaeon]